jgi:hypothetical protein
MIIKIEKYQKFSDAVPKYYVWVDNSIVDTFHSEEKAVECARIIHNAGFYTKSEILLTINTTPDEQ